MTRTDEEYKKLEKIKKETLLSYFIDDADELFALARLIEDKTIMNKKMIQLVVCNIERIASGIKEDAIQVYDDDYVEEDNEEEENERSKTE